MGNIVQWMKEQSPEKLREIMQGYPKHTDEYRLAELELQRKDGEQAKKDAEAAAKIEAQRHQEAIALDQQAISQSRLANRLALLAIGIAGAAFVVAILAWLFPREPQASGHKEPGSLSAVPALKAQAQPSQFSAQTNATQKP